MFPPFGGGVPSGARVFFTVLTRQTLKGRLLCEVGHLDFRSCARCEVDCVPVAGETKRCAGVARGKGKGGCGKRKRFIYCQGAEVFFGKKKKDRQKTPFQAGIHSRGRRKGGTSARASHFRLARTFSRHASRTVCTLTRPRRA